MFSQNGTDKKPARTDTFAESLHCCREAEKMAQRQPIWRLRGARATYLALEVDHSSTAASLDTRPESYRQSSLPATSRLVERLRRRARRHLSLRPQR